MKAVAAQEYCTMFPLQSNTGPAQCLEDKNKQEKKAIILPVKGCQSQSCLKKRISLSFYRLFQAYMGKNQSVKFKWS